MKKLELFAYLRFGNLLKYEVRVRTSERIDAPDDPFDGNGGAESRYEAEDQRDTLGDFVGNDGGLQAGHMVRPAKNRLGGFRRMGFGTLGLHIFGNQWERKPPPGVGRRRNFSVNFGVVRTYPSPLGEKKEE